MESDDKNLSPDQIKEQTEDQVSLEVKETIEGQVGQLSGKSGQLIKPKVLKVAGKSKKTDRSWTHLPRKRKLTAKQARYVGHLLDGETPTDAVIKAGYNASTRDSASHMASELLTKPVVRSTLADSIKKGQYDQRFTSKWDEILERHLESKPQDFAATANVQLKAMEQIARIGGLIAPKQVETRTLNLSAILPERKEEKK